MAFASHRILAHYFSWTQGLDLTIGPLLEQQLRAWGLTERQENLGKRLGEAVANSLIAKRSPAGEFTLGPVKKALTANLDPAPGVFRFYDPSPAGRAAATFFFTTPILWQPFVIPHPVQFVKEHLSELKPPAVPSPEWDADWKALKDIGRADWPGRTAEMNFISNLIACPRLNSPSVAASRPPPPRPSPACPTPPPSTTLSSCSPRSASPSTTPKLLRSRDHRLALPPSFALNPFFRLCLGFRLMIVLLLLPLSSTQR